MTFDEAIAAGEITQEEAFAIFDALPTVEPEQMIGTWRGSDFKAHHPSDGQLTSSGWFGKRFKDLEWADPLVYYAADGKDTFAADPQKLMGLQSRGASGKISEVRDQVETDMPAARLRSIVFRGKPTATMIYDQLPIYDHFRRVDDNTVLGAMDARGDTKTFFFVLRRED